VSEPQPHNEPEIPKPSFFERSGLKTALFFTVLGLIGLTLAVMDLKPDLGHVEAAVLSGPAQGNYHAVVMELHADVSKDGGALKDVVTAGSTENLQRLMAAADECDVEFALVQNGLAWPEGLELVGRLPRSESVFFLGKTANDIRRFSQLAGRSIGIGPKGSGTATVARQILTSPEFSQLNATLTHHTVSEQLDLLVAGKLDVGVFVIDEDSDLIKRAVRERGLQIASFDHADVIARRFEFARVGRIGAGQYDAVALLPKEDKRVLRVDTLVVSNGCASHSVTIGLLRLLTRAFPMFMRHNQETANTTQLALAPEAQKFFAESGPDFFDEHVPWLTDWMPIKNFVYIFVALSVISAMMGYVNRFRLWRIDANRVRAERYLPVIFGPGLTLTDIEALAPSLEHGRHRHHLDECIALLEKLSAKVRRQSLSLMVPMAEEMAYRYQEQLIDQTLDALRGFKQRLATMV